MSIYTVKEGVWSGGAIAGNGRQLARESTGRLWCCYWSYDLVYSYQIYCSYSDDNGETWTEEQVTEVEFWCDQYWPAIAIDSGDNLHLVWHATGYGANPDDSNIQYRKRTSFGWQAIESVTDVAYYQGAACIAIDSWDDIHVAWHGLGWGSNPNDYNIQYRKRTGAGWQVQEAITDKSDWQMRPAIAIDSWDNVHVAWGGRTWGENPTVYNARYRKRTGVGWGDHEAITDVAYSQEGTPCVAVDSSDDIHVVWVGKGWGSYPAEWNVQYRKKEGAFWQDQEAVSDGIYQMNPSIAMDSGDNVHVVWTGKGYENNPTKFNVQYRERTGAGWQDREAITDRAYNSYDCCTLWALHPTVSGAKPNILETGFTFVWTGQDAAGYNVEFYIVVVAVAPTVTTQAMTEIEPTTALGNGNITDNGGEDCDKRGIVYDTSSHGDPGDTAPADSEYADYVEETDSFGIGVFTGALTGLEPETPYYVRAYAHNSKGYSYGDEVSFTTQALAIPSVSTNPATSVGQTTATKNGTLDDDGGEDCSVRFEYGETTDYGFTTSWQSGKSTGNTFSQEVRGLNPSLIYHFRAVATNSAGTSYGDDRTLRTSELSAEAHQAQGRHFSMGRHGL